MPTFQNPVTMQLSGHEWRSFEGNAVHRDVPGRTGEHTLARPVSAIDAGHERLVRQPCGVRSTTHTD